MKLFKVYKHASGALEAVKQGWSWPGCLFIFVWAFVKRMWLIGVIALFGYGILGVFDSIDRTSGGAAQFVVAIISFIANCIFGMFGNGWRETNLVSRGFLLIDTIFAGSPEEAITSVTNSDKQPTETRKDTPATSQNVFAGISKAKTLETLVIKPSSNPENREKVVKSYSTQQADPLNEEHVYTSIANELESGNTDKGLWTRLFAEYDGDEKRTKVAYIRKRAEHLIAIERARLEQEARERDVLDQQRRHYEAALQAEANRIKKDSVRCKRIITLAKEHSAIPRKTIDEKVALLKLAGGEFEWTKGYERYGFCSAIFCGGRNEFKSGEEFSTWFNAEVVPFLLTL